MDEMFIERILDIADPERKLSPDKVLIIVEEKFSSHNKPKPQLPADIKGKFRQWCYEQTSFPREFVQIVNDHFWDLI